MSLSTEGSCVLISVSMYKVRFFLKHDVRLGSHRYEYGFVCTG